MECVSHRLGQVSTGLQPGKLGRGDILEGSTLVIPQRVEDHSSIELFAAHLSPCLLPPLTRGRHSITADKDNLLVFTITLGVAFLAALLEERPNGLFEHADPALNGRCTLGGVTEVTGDLTNLQTCGGPVLALLLLTLSLKLSGLVLDTLSEARIPELSDLVGNDLDGVGRVDFPVAGKGGLNVRYADETVW